MTDFEQTGSRITLFSKFGVDPLETRPDLQEARMQGFAKQYNELESIFSYAVNGNLTPFREGLLLFISLTNRLSYSI